ncbi:MAG: hypothetical protein ABJO88_00015 [Parasphingorhabdus sp.]
MRCIERDLSLLKFPTEVKQWTLAAKKAGYWFRRGSGSAVHEALGRYGE